MKPSAKYLLEYAKTPAFLVSNLTNIRYLTGLQLSMGMLLVLPKRYVLFVDSRYRETADRLATASLAVRDLGDFSKMMEAVSECGFEADDVHVARFSNCKKKFKNTKFIQKMDCVEHFRRSKSEDELKYIKKAKRITKELMRRIPSALRASITEEKLARQINIWALELGAEGMAFDSIVAFGKNTSIPHHHPTSKSLKKGEIVQIDIGAKYKGYCSDASEVFFTVPPTSLQQKTYVALVEAQKTAFELLRVGVTNRALDTAARDVLRREGIEQYFSHSLGHGVGLDIHEGVTLSSKAPETKLLKNEVITLEPGVYFPGKFGMRVEDTFIVE
jgi:Xaa-Pro aminopeptidase